jgi:signal peptidase I
MNGDGFGSPPWGPAEPVPEPDDDTQALPGLGSVPGQGESSGPSPSASGWGNVDSAWLKGGQAERRANGDGASFTPSGTGGANGQPPNGAGANGRGWSVPAETSTDLFGGKAAKDAGAEPVTPTGAGKRGKGEAGQEGGKHRRRSFWRELPVLVIIALVLALVIKAFVVQAFWIPSGSMENTLEVNDRVLINKVVYHLRPIHRGDIVVFDGTGSWDFGNQPASSNIFAKAFGELEGLVGVSQDSNIYIKRVIGLPGDHVVCCNAKGQVTVNGVALSESSYLYPGNSPSATKFSITVPAGRLWVMGDHRQISDDSRGHIGDPGGGTIPESGVLGRAFVVIWPPSHWGFLNIPATFQQPALNASNPAAAGGNPAALESAMDNGTPVQQAASPIPLALGFVGAVPITWLQRRLRTRRRLRRSKASKA